MSKEGPTRTGEYDAYSSPKVCINYTARRWLQTQRVEREILRKGFFHFLVALPWRKAAVATTTAMAMAMWTPANRKGRSGSWSALRWCHGPWALPLPTLCFLLPRSLSPSIFSSPTTTTILLLRSSLFLSLRENVCAASRISVCRLISCRCRALWLFPCFEKNFFFLDFYGDGSFGVWWDMEVNGMFGCGEKVEKKERRIVYLFIMRFFGTSIRLTEPIAFCRCCESFRVYKFLKHAFTFEIKRSLSYALFVCYFGTAFAVWWKLMVCLVAEKTCEKIIV